MSKKSNSNFDLTRFLLESLGLNLAERGQYITLLALQRLDAHFSLKEIRVAVGEPSPDVLAKLTKDSEGRYYDKNREIELLRHQNFLQKQRENGSKGGRPRKAVQKNNVEHE